MLFTDEIVIRAFTQGAITLPEALTVLDNGPSECEGGEHQPSPTLTQRDADMARAPEWKVYNDEGEYIGALKHASDAAAVVSLYPHGTIRWEHKYVVYRNGYDGDASESYDAVAEKCFAKRGALRASTSRAIKYHARNA